MVWPLCPRDQGKGSSNRGAMDNAKGSAMGNSSMAAQSDMASVGSTLAADLQWRSST